MIKAHYEFDFGANKSPVHIIKKWVYENFLFKLLTRNSSRNSILKPKYNL